MGVSGLRVASLRRRTAAKSIDFVVWAPMVAGYVALYVAYTSRRDTEAGPPRLPGPSRRWQVLCSLVGNAAAVRWRNSRGVVGLRGLTSRLQPRGTDGTGAQTYGRAVLVLAVLQGSALWPPLHQNLPDRLAGILVVED